MIINLYKNKNLKLLWEINCIYIYLLFIIDVFILRIIYKNHLKLEKLKLSYFFYFSLIKIL